MLSEPAYQVSRLRLSSSSEISSPSSSSLFVRRTLQIWRGVALVDLGRSSLILEMLPGLISTTCLSAACCQRVPPLGSTDRKVPCRTSPFRNSSKSERLVSFSPPGGGTTPSLSFVFPVMAWVDRERIVRSARQ